ncbi:MAG: transposase, partial [Mycobacterium sp.]
TTAGPITLQRPKLRNTTERFASQLFGKGVTTTNAPEALVIAGFVRGLSVRDVEAALTEALDESAAVSKSTVSRICAEIKAQYEAWSRRRLDDVELDYLFLDASHFRYHANASAEPVLAAWGINTHGKPVFIGLDVAAAESGHAWEGFLTDLGERGLGCPLLLISAKNRPRRRPGIGRPARHGAGRVRAQRRAQRDRDAEAGRRKASR